MSNMNNYIETLATVYADVLYRGFKSYSQKRQEVIDKLNQFNPSNQKDAFQLFVEFFVQGNYDLEGDDRYGLYARHPEIGYDISEHPKYESLLEQMEDDFAYEIILPMLNQTTTTA
jgi:hypothetical protein